MTTYLNNYNNYIYSTNYNDSYNGVARVSTGEYYGTGALLYDGRSILSAAHVFEGYDNRNVTVYFDTFSGVESYNATVTLYENYDEMNSNGDIAILTLEENVISDYARYDIYRDDDEMGEIFTAVGYGSYGSGLTGELEYETDILKLKTQNTFDTDFYDIYDSLNTNLAWEPLEDSIVTADFDNGYYSNDAIGHILGLYDLGLGTSEGMIASGDSGGPAFIDNLVAGVASYSASISSNGYSTDINDYIDSSFGELGAWQRVSYYSEWIDKTIRANYENVPSSREEVKKYIVESDDSIVYTYFLLEYLGVRDEIQDNITLHFSTRDGTATAGEDYIFTSGTITLYQDESSVLIPVEILPDMQQEDNETFYLDVTNPSHGYFESGATTLTAVRTIIDDNTNIA